MNLCSVEEREPALYFVGDNLVDVARPDQRIVFASIRGGGSAAIESHFERLIPVSEAAVEPEVGATASKGDAGLLSGDLDSQANAEEVNDSCDTETEDDEQCYSTDRSSSTESEEDRHRLNAISMQSTTMMKEVKESRAMPK